jgi:hypothetical protein
VGGGLGLANILLLVSAAVLFLLWLSYTMDIRGGWLLRIDRWCVKKGYARIVVDNYSANLALYHRVSPTIDDMVGAHYSGWLYWGVRVLKWMIFVAGFVPAAICYHAWWVS